MDKYEKLYKEALEGAKGLLEIVEEDKVEITKDDVKSLFPELAESEDEKVIKALETFINQPEIAEKITFEARIMWLSWLEKQKEQKEELVHRLNGLMQDYIKEGKDDEEKEHRLKCYQLFWNALEDTNFFEQKEQKPAEWNPEDEQNLNVCLSYIKDEPLRRWLKDAIHVRYVKPAEWSEEDERMLSRCEKSIESSKQFADSDTFKKAKDNEIDWLENRFKSLRPSWKPSEEQLNALNFAITYFIHETNYKNPTELRDLFDDLLKLK